MRETQENISQYLTTQDKTDMHLIYRSIIYLLFHCDIIFMIIKYIFPFFLHFLVIIVHLDISLFCLFLIFIIINGVSHQITVKILFLLLF